LNELDKREKRQVCLCSVETLHIVCVHLYTYLPKNFMHCLSKGKKIHFQPIIFETVQYADCLYNFFLSVLHSRSTDNKSQSQTMHSFRFLFLSSFSRLHSLLPGSRRGRISGQRKWWLRFLQPCYISLKHACTVVPTPLNMLFSNCEGMYVAVGSVAWGVYSRVHWFMNFFTILEVWTLW
jgi:hypothetical protein